MTEEEFIKIVSDTFDEEISADCNYTTLGCISHITGKTEFMNTLVERLRISLGLEKQFNSN